MLTGFRRLKDFDLGSEFEVIVSNPNTADDFSFLKILVSNTTFLSILSFFSGYYFHAKLRGDQQNFKEEVYKIVASFNPLIFSQDSGFVDNFFQKIFNHENVKLENIPVKPTLNVFYPLIGYADESNKINFQANMNFYWKENLLNVDIYVMRDRYMVFDLAIREFSGFNNYPPKFFDVSNGKIFFVLPFEVSFYPTKMGEVFRIFSQKEGIVYERFVFNIYNTIEGYIVHWASGLGINQLFFPKTHNLLSIVVSCLTSYFGNFLDFKQGFEINPPYWMLKVNSSLPELVNKTYYYEGKIGNWNFYTFIDVANYKGIFWEIIVDFMIGYSKDWFFYIRSAVQYDRNFYIQNYGRLLDRQKKIMEGVKFVEEFNRNYYNKMKYSYQSSFYDKQVADIIYKDMMEERAHRKRMYEKLRETNRYVSEIYRDSMEKSSKSRDAFVKGFSAAINNETYVRSQTGEIYRVPSSQGFSNLNYYENNDLIVGLKDYDYSNSQYLQSLGFRKMEEDIFGFQE